MTKTGKAILTECQKKTDRVQKIRFLFILACLFVILQAFFFTHPLKSDAAKKKTESAAASDPAIQMPSDMTKEEVDAFLAALSDEQARKLLAAKLRQEARGSAKGEPTSDKQVESIFNRWERHVSTSADQAMSVLSSTLTRSTEWELAFERILKGRSAGYFIIILAMAAAIILFGLIAERMLARYTNDVRQQILTRVSLGRIDRFSRFLSRFLLDILSAAAYVFSTFILFALIFDRNEPAYGVISEILMISYYYRVIMLAARIVLSPASPALRLLPVADEDVVFLWRWMKTIVAAVAVLVAPAAVFRTVGGSRDLFILFFGSAGMVFTLLLVFMIWQSRKRVAGVIYPEAEASETPSLRQKLAESWHAFAILFVLFIGMLWVLNVFSGGKAQLVKLIASLFLIPIFIGVDQWGRRLLLMAASEEREIIDLSGDEPQEKETSEAEPLPTDDGEPKKPERDIRHFIPLIQKLFRYTLIAVLFFTTLKLWGIDLAIARIFASGALDIIIILILGFLAWQFIRLKIDQKLKEEMPDEEEDMEEGGAGGSRSVTLLILLRKFVLSVMIVLITLTVLSAIGVNIGPLIAGAGVFGLAIGFGAQTLVRDIISGVFFLIDDSFRVGDYVEAGSARGTVEHISLRSMKLRHSRGMVFTVPFGGIKSIKNFSRDYIITKLNILVKYNTDVDKVRKIIKKINKDLQKHEEMGPVLLGKIKSQGVKSMDDSAMRMRVKFKTIPGEQFIVQREVYQRIQKAFRENGIEFAHKNVTVYLPPELIEKANTADKEKLLAEAGGAAAASLQAEEDANDLEKAKAKKKE